MLAVSSNLPPDPLNYTFEYKWDGIRCICFWDGNKLRLHSRNLIDITSRYPEFLDLPKPLQKHALILDGEIIALDSQQRPSFARLQRRMQVANPSSDLQASVPVVFVIFDLLFLDGEFVGNRPQRERRQILETLGISGDHWQLTPSHEGEGKAMLAAAVANQLEGLVAKRLDSIYEQGRRSPNWRKIKTIQRQEMVIGGWVPEGRASDSQRIGSLLMGYHDERGKLRFAGAVGTGFNAAAHERLFAALSAHPRKVSSFSDLSRKAGALFVAPKLVAEIEYRRWPQGGLIQHASYKGLRADKPARQVIREELSGSDAVKR